MTTFEIFKEKPEKIFAELGPKMGKSADDIEMFEAVLDTIRTLGDEKIRPNVAEWDEIGAKLVDGKVVLPESMQKLFKELVVDNEMNAFFIPKEYGGYGFGNLAMSALTEVMCQYDIGFQILSFISMSVMEALVVYHQDNFNPMLEKFASGEYSGYVGFTEADAGSHLQNVKTTSVLDGDEYVINGTKIFISNGGHANCGLVLARNMVDGEMKGHNVFVVEGLEGITTERLEHKSGIRANPTAQLHFKDVRVPKENIISDVGKGYKKVLERLMGMRLGVAFQGTGAAIRSLELSQQYAEERIQFGKPIGSFPPVASKIKHMELVIPRMKAYGYKAAMALDRFYKGWLPMDVGAPGDAAEKMAAANFPSAVISGLTHYYISQAKMFTSEVSNTVAYDAQQIYGGNGFVSEYEINKIARDVRVLPVYEGTSEIHSFIISRAQDAINMLPKSKFSINSAQWEGEEESIHEKFFYDRFPELKGKM